MITNNKKNDCYALLHSYIINSSNLGEMVVLINKSL